MRVLRLPPRSDGVSEETASRKDIICSSRLGTLQVWETRTSSSVQAIVATLRRHHRLVIASEKGDVIPPVCPPGPANYFKGSTETK